MAAPLAARIAADVALDSRGPRVLVGGLLGLLALPLAAVLVVIVAVGQLVGGDHPGPITSGSEIPVGLVDVFNEAARVFHVNAFLLAAIAAQESAFGAGAGWQTVNPAGCVGLMQICVGGAGGDSWNQPVTLTGPAPVRRAIATRDAYRHGQRPASYSHQRPGHPDILDSFDAVMAAAVHLRAKVAGRPIPLLDQRAYQAACGYYGACADLVVNYAAEVLERARRYQAQQLQLPAAGALGLGETLAGGTLRWPTATRTVSSVFCEPRAWEACHPGIDIPIPAGTAVHASAAGRVRIAAPVSGYGNYVCVTHTASVESCYAHLTRIAVYVGQHVTAGRVIGVSGCTGRCYGPHLHYEVRIQGRPTCPAAFLSARESAMCAPGWRQRSTVLGAL